jgi:hypothetical protein
LPPLTHSPPTPQKINTLQTSWQRALLSLNRHEYLHNLIISNLHYGSQTTIWSSSSSLLPLPPSLEGPAA